MDLIKRTFQHIKGINPKKEKLLWEEGVFDWQDAIEKIDYYAMPKSIKESLKEELPESIYNFNSKNYNYFIKKNTGSIQINQTINPDAEKLLQMIQAAVPILSDSGDTSETLESIKDDLDSITEQLQSEHPKKSRVRKALDGIKSFAGDVCSDTASTALSGAPTRHSAS